MSSVAERNANALFVEDFVSNRVQDILLHHPPAGDPTIPRDVRRRANAVVKQPHYYKRNHSKNNRNSQYPDLHLLPLHNYNSKRMKMSSMWGWYLPEKHNQRIETGILKHVSSKPIVHDSSYFENIILQGGLYDSFLLLQEITCEKISDACQSAQVMQTIQTFVKQQNSTLYLGPVDVVCDGTSTLWLSCHPSIAQPLFDCLSANLPLNLTISRSPCCRLSLRGSCEGFVTQLFPSVKEQATHHQITLTTFHKPHNSHVYFAPEYTQTKDLSRQRQTLPKQVYFFKQTQGEEEVMEEEPTSLSFTDIFTNSSTCCLVTVQHANKHKAACGFELFVSCEKVRDVWNTLLDNRVIPVAQKEWHCFYTYIGIPLFPYDYPDSPVGLKMCLEYYTTPFMQPDNPVNINLSQNSIIAMHAHLHCFSNLLSVARSQDKLKKALPHFSQLEGNDRCLIAVNVRVIGKGSISLPCSIRIPTEEDLQLRESNRFIPAISNDIMGFVTSCLYSRKASSYVGIGFCASTELWETLRDQKSRSECIVLLADNHSPSACFARLTILNEW